MSDKKRSQCGVEVEVDPTALAERIIVYQPNGECSLIAPAHEGVIAINPLMEAIANVEGRVAVWVVLNRGPRRVIISSLQISISYDPSFGVGAATLQKYDIKKIFLANKGSFSSNVRYSQGTPKRTATKGMIMPEPSRSGSGPTFYDSGYGGSIALFPSSNFSSTSGIGSLLTDAYSNASTAGPILWTLHHGRVTSTTAIFSRSHFVHPANPVTYLDCGDALVMYTTSSTDGGDLIYGSMEYSIHGDPLRGARG